MFDIGQIYVSLLINVLLLFSVGSIYILLPFRFKQKPFWMQVIIGVLSGVIGLMIMSSQFNITEGFLLDTRSVLVSLVGAFFGFIPMAITVLFTSLLRISQGGAGTFTGVLVIIMTGLVGYLYGRFRLYKYKKMTYKVIIEFYIFGVITHIVMLLCFYTLPLEVANFVLGEISIPVMILYPFASVLIAMVLFKQRLNVAMANKIDEISKRDFLTGLYNRYFYENALSKYNKKEFMPLSIIIGDVNGLKIVNDSFGHLVGDQLLIHITSILKDNLNEQDVLARWGGDEFVIIMPNTSINEANMRIINIVKDCNNQEMDNGIIPSISLGTATKMNIAESLESILIKAEDLMYRNKLSTGKSSRSNLISILENALLERSLETSSHTKRMEQLSLILANELELPQADIDALKVISKLHDIGKIGISDTILLKKGSLDETEYEMIKKHPRMGYRILSSIDELQHIATGVLCHHEKWDGTGYPQGLIGEEIPLLSRIVSVTDAYEVMTNGRVYKDAISKEEALEELYRCKGTQFDPKLVNLFINLIKEREI